MSDKKKIVKESKVVVTRTFRKNGVEGKPEVKEETLGVHAFVTPPAETGLALGLTLNLGGYETARIDVRCFVPCYREELEDAYSFADRFVKDRIQKEVDDVRKSRDNNSSF